MKLVCPLPLRSLPRAVFDSCAWQWLKGYRICPKCGRPTFVPWVGKIPWRREWQPTSGLLPGEPHGQRSLASYSSWGWKESATTERLTHTESDEYACSLLSTYCVPGSARSLLRMLYNPHTSPVRMIPISQVREWSSLILCDASKITRSQQPRSPSVCKASPFCKSRANHCVLWHLSIPHGKYVSFCAVPSLL